MTPTRAKRNPKVPNRFSSDNSRIETSNANGETIIDYNDKSTSTTHNLVPMNTAIKLKPVIREPLKVKLPKLKRLQQQHHHQHQQQQQTTKEHSVSTSLNDIKIHKIKLPSLSSKKSKTSSSIVKDSKSKSPVVQNHALTAPKQSNTTNDSQSKSLLAKTSSYPSTGVKTSQLNYEDTHSSRFSNSSSKLDVSTSSKSSEGGNESHSFSADSSLRTDDGDDTSSRMEIVVSKSENTNSSGIRCPCGVDDDLGVMVECESCSTWQHGHCINVGTEEEAYEGYKCAFCTAPREMFRHSLTQLTVDDKLLGRFNILESLRKQNNSHSHEFLKLACDEKNIYFTMEELNQAVKDLKRVLGSLKVKWRLLTNPAYDLELRIWQNPYWSEEKETNQEHDKNLYIGDRCRSNLKLNIRNMVKKMSTRCHLINHALSLVKSVSYNQSQEDQLRESIIHSLELIDREVRELKIKLKNL